MNSVCMDVVENDSSKKENSLEFYVFLGPQGEKIAEKFIDFILTRKQLFLKREENLVSCSSALNVEKISNLTALAAGFEGGYFAAGA